MDVRAWLNVLRTKKKNGEYQKKWKRTPAPFLKVERFSTENPQSDQERYRLFENNKKDASAQDKKKPLCGHGSYIMDILVPVSWFVAFLHDTSWRFLTVCQI